MSSVLFTALNGFSIAMLLFLVAVGLTLIFGLMDVLNLSHGAVFLVGAYVAYSVMDASGNFLVAVLAAAVVTTVLGLLVEPLLLRPLYGRPHLDQVLVTLGLSYVLADLVLWIWGPDIRSPAVPDLLSGSVSVAGFDYPVYRLFVAGVGVAVAVGLVVLRRKTIWGAVVRAGVQDMEMVTALGINARRVFLGGLAVGFTLAGIAGALGGPITGLTQGLDATQLILSLVVVVVGGLGTLGGSFFGALIIGMAQSFGAYLVPEFAAVLVYGAMVLVLVARPQGLMGQTYARP